MIAFRPLPVMSVLALASLVILGVLGQWQWSKIGWKRDQLARWEATAAPVALPALCGIEALNLSPPVSGLSPDPQRSLRVYGFDADGAPGWRVMGLQPAPDCLAGGAGRFVLAETRFEPMRGEARPATLWRAQATPPKTALSAPNAPERGEFHAYDRAVMAATLGLADPDALVFDLILTADDGQPPQSLTAVPPERHLGYALTWWGLAGALLVVYVAFHIRAGRLGLRRRKEPA